MGFQISLGLVSFIAGAVASVAGFGIGSLITPLLALKVGTGLAVAAVSIAHFLGTAVRFWFWRKYINRKILFSFGLTSAAAGLLGALLHNTFYNPTLTIIFGGLLIFAGFSGLTGLSEKLRFEGIWAWIAGGLSGLFGGLVGNQGGIRSAALLGFDLDQKQFVATATGIALAVDIARVPIYLTVQSTQLKSIWVLILIATVGVLIGTALGGWILRKIPHQLFTKTVSIIIFLIGIFVLIHQ